MEETMHPTEGVVGVEENPLAPPPLPMEDPTTTHQHHNPDATVGPFGEIGDAPPPPAGTEATGLGGVEDHPPPSLDPHHPSHHHPHHHHHTHVNVHHHHHVDPTNAAAAAAAVAQQQAPPQPHVVDPTQAHQGMVAQLKYDPNDPHQNLVGPAPEGSGAATATEADIAAIAGGVVAAVEAGEAQMQAAAGAADPNKPNDTATTIKEEDAKVAAAAAAVVDPAQAMYNATFGPPTAGPVPPPPPPVVPQVPAVATKARTSAEAGLGEAGAGGPSEKVIKRQRRKAEPIKPFNDMLYELMAFRSREGHCRVPVDNKSALGRWVASLRSQYSSLQKGYPTADLTEERLMILRNIDFIWDLQQFDSDARWKRQFEDLVAYKRENGHCNAPQSTPLGKWVKMQRENYRETQLRLQGALPQNRTKPRPTLSDERIAQLQSIGFQWKVAPPAAGWEHRFEELVEYKRMHGDCNVPQAWPENRQLGRWVMKQRCQYTLRQKGERCQITDERIHRLNELGFSWTAPSFRKNKKMDDPSVKYDIRPKWL